MLLAACAIKQSASPVPKELLDHGPPRIVLVRNTVVRNAAFHGELQRALERRGFIVESMPMDTELAALPLAMTYGADWSWDTTLLLQVHLDVYRAGVKVGDVEYDARKGWYAAKHVDTGRKVDELVGDVFPGRASQIPGPEVHP